MSQKAATVAVINETNKVLILRRGATAPWMPGRYCFPGGGVESDESIQYAACRELEEETGLVYPCDNLESVFVTYVNGYIKTVFVAKINDPKVVLNFEHDEYAFVSYSESLYYQLVPGLNITLKTLVSKDFLS